MRTTASSVLAMAGMASTVSAHALMFGVWVNGVDQGDGRNDYIRTPPNNSPVKDLASPQLVCGANGAKEAPNFVSAAAGDTLSFEWFHDNRGDDIIDGSHVGPIITYIAEYTSGDGTGPIWTKIAEDGFDGSKWAVDKLKANKGLNDFVLPPDLAAGDYLVRQEIIAHHESDTAFNVNPARGAQFYPSCVQLKVTEGGSAVPDQAFDFNTGYTYADPGIVFNVYTSFTSYDIPGPEVWTGQNSGGGSGNGNGSGGASTPRPTATATATATSSAAPVASTPATGGGNGGSVPSPVFSSVEAAPTTTLATVTTPATQPTAAPPTQCSRKRSLKARKARKAKRSTQQVRRVGRAQF